MSGYPALRTSWSAVGRTLITDGQGNQVVSPARDIGPMFDAEAWERLAPVLAAAPTMLEALHQAAIWIQRDEHAHGRNFGVGNVIRAAIAKAEGK